MAKATPKKAPKAAPKAARKPIPSKKKASVKSVPVKTSKPAKLSRGKPVASKPAPNVVSFKTSKITIKPRPPVVKSPPKAIKRFEPEVPHRDFVMPPPPPLSADGKPRKNMAGLHVRELEHYRELLLLKRRELVGDMSAMEREALRTAGGSNLSNLPLHMADMGTDNYEQEFTLGLVEKDRQLLREINNALAKIQNGLYGICEGTGKPIGKPRLEAQPWAKYSIEYARQLEQRQMIRR